MIKVGQWKLRHMKYTKIDFFSIGSFFKSSMRLFSDLWNQNWELGVVEPLPHLDEGGQTSESVYFRRMPWYLFPSLGDGFDPYVGCINPPKFQIFKSGYYQ